MLPNRFLWLRSCALRYSLRAALALAVIVAPLSLTPSQPAPARAAPASAPLTADPPQLTPAVGGGSLSLDNTFAPGGDGVAITLAGPVYEEAAPGDLGVGRLTLQLPPGFAFDVKVTPTVTVSAANGGTCSPASPTSTQVNFARQANATITATTAHVSISRASQGDDRCAITWAGLRVQQTGTVPVAAALTTVGGGAIVAGNQPGVTSWGALTSLPGKHAAFRWSGQPGGGTGGTPWLAQPVVESHDRFANARIHDTSSRITIMLVPGTGTAGAALACDGGLARTLSGGAARFAGCTLDRVGNGYVLRATTDAPPNGEGTTGRDSAPLSVALGAAAKLAFALQPDGGPAGAVWVQQPRVAIQDAGGNLRLADTMDVTIELGANPSAAALVCTPAQVPATAGVAQFAGCTVDRAGSGYTLLATSPGLQTAESVPFAIGGDPPALLRVESHPSGATGGIAFGVQPSVRITDLEGAPLTGDSTTRITASVLDPLGNGGTLSGIRTVTAWAGLATFAGLAVDRAGPGYVLLFTADNGAPAVISAPFTVVTGPPAAIEALSGDGQEATVGAALSQPMIVRITDRGGNPVAGAGVSWAVTGQPGPGAVLNDGPEALIADTQGGVQNNLTLGIEPGTYEVTVTCTLCPSANRTAVFHATGLAGPTVTSLSPAALGQGAGPIDLAIVGADFRDGDSAFFGGTGVTVHAVERVTAERLRLSVSVSATASPGVRMLTLITVDGVALVFGQGLEIAPAPIALAASPAVVRPLLGNQALAVTGTGFSVGAEVTAVGAAAPVQAHTVVVTDATRLTATLLLPLGSEPGPRSLLVTNPDGGTSISAPLFSVPGMLRSPALAVTSLASGASSRATLSVTVTQAVDPSGKLVLTFPTDTNLAGAAVTALSSFGVDCPVPSSAVVGAELDVPLDGCPVAAETTVRLIIEGIVNGSAGAYDLEMRTYNADGLLLDEGTVMAAVETAPTPTPTATPTITPTPTRTPVPPRGGGGGGAGGGTTGAQPTLTATPRPTATPLPLPPGADVPAPPVEPVSATLSVTQPGGVQAGAVSLEFPARAAGSSGMMTVTVDPLPPAGETAPTLTLQASVHDAVVLPDGYLPGTLAFRMNLKDGAGRRITQFAMPVTVTVRFGGEDLRLAGNLPAGVQLFRFDDAAGTWTLLENQRPGPNPETLAAETYRPGVFALMASVPRPGLLGPPDSSLITDMAPVLAWTPASTVRWHHVQIIPFNNDGPAVNLIVGDPATVARGRFAVPPPVFGQGPYLLLPGMTYAWRVRVSTSLLPMGEGGPGWSAWLEGSFRTGAPTSATITLVQPPHESTAMSRTPVLIWANRNDRIFYYEVQVSRDAQFQTDPRLATAAVYWNLVHGGVTVPLNSFAVPYNAPLDAGEDYYWRVRPRVQGDGAPVDWTSAGVFRTP